MLVAEPGDVADARVSAPDLHAIDSALSGAAGEAETKPAGQPPAPRVTQQGSGSSESDERR
jgi:hypothetical protein